MTPRVVVADPTPFGRLGIRMALASGGIEITAEAADGPAAVQAVLAGSVDVLLIDEALDPDMALVHGVCRAHPELAVIVLAADMSDAAAWAAVRAGACGFLPKATPPDRLTAIVMGAFDGEAAIPRRIVRRLLAEISEAHVDPAPKLSPRERQVLDLLAQGLPDQIVGQRLGVSGVTVRRHAAAAVQKLGAGSRVEAIGLRRA